MRLPPLIAAVLRERPICIGFLIAGLLLIASQTLGLRIYACPFHLSTGLPCPGCGLTRGTLALVQGRWQESWRYHPFSPLVPIGGVLLILSLLLPEPRRQRLLAAVEMVERKTALAYLILAALMIFGLWRMGSHFSDVG